LAAEGRQLAIEVREIGQGEHLAWIAARPSVSFLQTPAWGRVKAEWRAESVGWFDGDTQLGAALVLYRPAPVIKKSLAYVPEGPDLDWDAAPADELLKPLVNHAKRQGAFALTIGPRPWLNRWSTATVKAALADSAETGKPTRFADIAPDEHNPQAEKLAEQMRQGGWLPPARAEGFSDGQPSHVFQIGLEGQTEESLLAGFNQLWRRNIKRADKAGVEVALGDRDDIPGFHAVYAETAVRDGFTPRPLAYFLRMWDELRAEDPQRLRLYLARHEGDLVAATTMTKVGDHAWYSYGASTTAKRDVRGSNAVQWRMMRDALAEGCRVYDMRGITDTLDAADPHVGLVQFKAGTGGFAQEYMGEWTYPISPLVYRAFLLAMRARRAL
jgi:lipid II:glycine glycyltransferase (peptidoglycan interpeptide bridge formation enzyme)